jgi:hypothetical protein
LGYGILIVTNNGGFMFANICLGIIALYVLTEVGTAIYILRNRATAIPRIRIALRNLLGLDQDSMGFRQAVGDVSREVQDVGYRISSEHETIQAAFANRHVELKNVVETHTNKVVRLTARRKNGKR